MKSVKYIFGIILIAAATTACHNYNEPKTPPYVDENSPEAWKATHTIHEFLEDYLTKLGNEEKYPPRARSHKGNDATQANLGLFSVDDIPADSLVGDVIIVGRIASSDVAGNIYKTLYIQDVTDPRQGLKISVDAGSLSGILPMGQVIAIKCNGLAIGKYANMAQLGVPFFNNAKEGLDNAKKKGWEIGRIPLPVFMEHIQLIGTPDISKIDTVPMTIDEFPAIDADFMTIAKWAGRLVRIDNVYFTQQEYNLGKPADLDEADKIFAPSTDGIGYPQSRIFALQSDPKKISAIGTSEYAKFADAPLPTSDYVGSITGFISYYWDKGGSSPDGDEWTLVLRSLDDVSLQNASGETWRADEIYYPKY